jgi:predicted anti-sigma-YlaC factor YlaD
MEVVMEISCREVFRELSGYIDQDIEPELRKRIQEHLANCRHCTAIYDGTRNVIRLVADDRAFELPVGFDRRLKQKLAKEFTPR